MMELQQARSLADALAEALSPGCERISVAGSVRRGKLEVHEQSCRQAWLSQYDAPPAGGAAQVKHEYFPGPS